MDKPRNAQMDESLDPDDWETMRALGHRMLDDLLEDLRTLREGPVWRHAPPEIKAHFDDPPPLEPQSPDEIYQEYLDYVRAYPIGNSHPRFWGWIAGTGTLMGAFAELLATGANTVSGAFAYHSSNYVETQVLTWLKEMLGYPELASGVLTSGCSAANLIGLAVARNTKAGYDLRRDGLEASSRKMVLYASQESHASNQKAVELLGLGSKALRLVPVDEHLRIDVDALKAAISADRAAGYLPFCVIGAAGTTNTGAIDDLNALADICQAEDLWFHVDGAFGAWAAIAERARSLVSGMERADSLAFDLHKWMYLPYAIGCVLVRDAGAHRYTFSLTPTYLAHGEGDRGMTGVDLPWASDYSFELSRGFPALKAWMTIKTHGTRKFSRIIQQNIDQAHYLASLVKAAPELELALRVSLNITCFRYTAPGLDDSALNELNKQIEIELHESGIAVPSIVTLWGVNYLHVAITNHRSRYEDFDILVREVIRSGNEIANLYHAN